MKIVRKATLIVFILLVFAGLSQYSFYIPVIRAGSGSVVSLNMPAQIFAGDTFAARISINSIQDLQAFQFQLTYDEKFVRIIGSENGPDGVSYGYFGTSRVLTDMWRYVSLTGTQRSVRVFGQVIDNLTVNGSGYLAEIHFQVNENIGQSSQINFSEGYRFQNGLFDEQGHKITTTSTWAGASFSIITAVPLNIELSELPGGAAGLSYSAQLSAGGGYPPYNWEIGDLPAGLTGLSSGYISGQTPVVGQFWCTVILHDGHWPDAPLSKTLLLKICPLGDANQDMVVTRADVFKFMRIYAGLDPPTRAADANADGVIDLKDAVQIQHLYTGH
jgi:hypothetical protein